MNELMLAELQYAFTVIAVGGCCWYICGLLGVLLWQDLASNSIIPRMGEVERKICPNAGPIMIMVVIMAAGGSLASRFMIRIHDCFYWFRNVHRSVLADARVEKQKQDEEKKKEWDT